MMLNSVDLPQPDGPMIETNSPGATLNEMSSTAVIGPSRGDEALGDALDVEQARVGGRRRGGGAGDGGGARSSGQPRSPRAGASAALIAGV